MPRGLRGPLHELLHHDLIHDDYGGVTRLYYLLLKWRQWESLQGHKPCVPPP